MKCRPMRWLWGLLPLALLCWVAIVGDRARVETDLHRRTQEALAKAGLPWAMSAFSGRDAILTGNAVDDSEKNNATEVARAVYGVRIVNEQTGLIEEAKQYTWSASLEDGRLRLKGFVPTENDRKTIMGMARASFPKFEVDDRMKLARGAPPKDAWLGGVNFSFKQLERLKKGRVELDGLALTVVGEAEDTQGYKLVKTALGGRLPSGVSIKQELVSPALVRPFTWHAEFAGAKLAMSGYVPSEKVKEELFGAAKRDFPRASVADRSEVAGGAPDGWSKAAVASLQQLARLEHGAADLRDAVLSFKGQAADEATAESVRKAVRGALPAQFKSSEQVAFREASVKPVSPYVTSAALESGALVLSGHAPNEEAKVNLLAAAKVRFPGRRIEDRLQLAAGASDAWRTCVDAGLVGLSRVGNGRATLTDRRIELSGETEDEALANSLPGDVRAGAKGCDSDVKIAFKAAPEPDLVWQASLSGNEVVLSGDVPSDAVKQDLSQSAQRYFPAMRILDRQKIASGRSPKWPRVAESGLKMLARLKKGDARLAGTELSVSGEAADKAIAGAIHDQLSRDLPPPYRGRDAIQVAVASSPPPTAPVVKVDECQQLLISTTKAGTIRFEYGKAELHADSYPTLKKLADVINRCPAASIEISGHTDADGDRARNQRLSERRAKSVAKFLAESGVGAARLEAIGYGQERPIAPNDTSENKAQNRRIDFTIKTR